MILRSVAQGHSDRGLECEIDFGFRRYLHLLAFGNSLGALIGAIAGRGKGAAIGAGIGAAAGAGAQAVTKGQQVKVPSETKIDFTLKSPLTVTLSH